MTDSPSVSRRTIAALLLLIAPATGLAGNLLSVDLRDIARWNKTTFPEARVILRSMAQNPALYFPSGIGFQEINYSQPEPLMPTRLPNWVHGVELLEIPLPTSQGTLSVKAVAFIESKNEGAHFRKYDITLGGSPLSVMRVDLIDSFPATDTDFSIRVGLVDRKAVLQDSRHGLRKIYPIGGSGFDEGISAGSHGRTRLMTPSFHHAWIEDREIISSRTEPGYYLGLPFIRFSRRDGTPTPYAFHIIQHDQMIRGFDSHGCLRLRGKDLIELLVLLKKDGAPRVSLDVSLQTGVGDDHPYPLREKDSRLKDGYMTVTNCAPKGEPPRSCKDNHGLTFMELKLGSAPIARLSALDEMDADLLSTDQMNDLLPDDPMPPVDVMPVDVVI